MRSVTRQLVAGLLGAAILTAGVIPPAATAASPRAGDGLGVITAISETQTAITAGFFFTGLEATGFVLAVPRQATLSSLSAAQIGRDISLTTLNGAHVHYIVLAAQPNYLSIALHAPQPDLRLTFRRALFTFSTTATRQIATHRLRSVRMGIAFSGTPGELVASKFSFAV